MITIRMMTTRPTFLVLAIGASIFLAMIPAMLASTVGISNNNQAYAELLDIGGVGVNLENIPMVTASSGGVKIEDFPMVTVDIGVTDDGIKSDVGIKDEGIKMQVGVTDDGIKSAIEAIAGDIDISVSDEGLPCPTVKGVLKCP